MEHLPKERFICNRCKTTIRYQGKNTDLVSLFTVKEITEGLTKKDVSLQ